MHPEEYGRRGFIKSAAALAVAGVISPCAHAQTIRRRVEWSEFRSSGSYAGFVHAIRAMRANTDSSDRRSWGYWTNIHLSACPHGAPYFLAWHRGYLHHFEQVVRGLSGDSTMMIPYWDYYRNPVMPPEFTDPASGNPLYVAGRKNTDVRAALTLSPFLPRYRNFQRGQPDAFEPVIETGPHGTLHNIVGGVMASMSSPMDPIFWLHHAQLDRLWCAWVSANDGRQMPPLSDPYWSRYHVYTPILKTARSMTYDTHSLFYDYADKTPPTALPSATGVARSSPLVFANAPQSEAPRRPPAGDFQPAQARELKNGRAAGGARVVALDENPLTVDVTLDADDGDTLRAIAGARDGRAAPRYRYVHLVLEGARTVGAGAEGGYFYDIYLDLPETGDAGAGQTPVGQFGAFEIDAHARHGTRARISFPLTAAVQASGRNELRKLAVSFVRRGSDKAPRGTVVVVGELRIELSNEPG